MIPGIKVYLLRKMSGREYKTGRSLFFFLLCFVAWLAALPLVVHYSSSGLVPNLVFWGGIIAYLVYRGAILTTIATRLGEPPLIACLYGIPFVGFVFITLAAFSSQRTIHQRQRIERERRTAPVYRYDQAQTQQPLHHTQQYGQPQACVTSTCSFCGEVNPSELSECRNCGSPLGTSPGRGWK